MNNFIWSRLAQTRKGVPFFFEEFIPKRDDQEADVIKVLGGVQDAVHQMSKIDILGRHHDHYAKDPRTQGNEEMVQCHCDWLCEIQRYRGIEFHTIFWWSPRYCTIHSRWPGTEGFQARFVICSACL